jgi:hypothetical protein
MFLIFKEAAAQRRSLVARHQPGIRESLIVPGIALRRRKTFGRIEVGTGALGDRTFPPHTRSQLTGQPAEIEVLAGAQDIAPDAKGVLFGVAGNVVGEFDAADNGPIALGDALGDVGRGLHHRSGAQRLVDIGIGIGGVVD